MTELNVQKIVEMQAEALRDIAERLKNMEDSTPGKVHSMGLRLLVSDRGHVWLGKMSYDSEWFYISQARIVRRWGTDAGLNQLAVGGPRADTIIDDPQDLQVSRRAVVAVIKCNEENWKKYA